MPTNVRPNDYEKLRFFVKQNLGENFKEPESINITTLTTIEKLVLTKAGFDLRSNENFSMKQLTDKVEALKISSLLRCNESCLERFLILFYCGQSCREIELSAKLEVVVRNEKVRQIIAQYIAHTNDDDPRAHPEISYFWNTFRSK